MSDLLKELNSQVTETHTAFILQPGFDIGVRKNCGETVCNSVLHRFDLSKTLQKILGFSPDKVMGAEVLKDEAIVRDFPSKPERLFAEKFAYFFGYLSTIHHRKYLHKAFA